MARATEVATGGNLAGEIKEACAAADAGGVHLLAAVAGDGIALLEIERDADAPRGAGAAALGALCAVADRAGVAVGLAATSRDEGLLGFYRHHGFVEVPSEDDDDDEDPGDVAMRRPAAGAVAG